MKRQRCSPPVNINNYYFCGPSQVELKSTSTQTINSYLNDQEECVNEEKDLTQTEDTVSCYINNSGIEQSDDVVDTDMSESFEIPVINMCNCCNKSYFVKSNT